MSKKSFERYKKKKRAGKDPPSSAGKGSGQGSGKSLDRVLFLFKNLLGGFLFFLLLVALVKNVNGYHWLFSKLLSNNLKTITKISHLPSKKKLEGKLKFPAKYCIRLSEKLPDTAVVLFPFDSTHLEKTPDIQYVDRPKKTFFRKPFVTYFIYPRKVVYAYEKGKNPLYERVTHVAIIDQMGYEYLNYRVAQKPSFTVLPINRKNTGR